MDALNHGSADEMFFRNESVNLYMEKAGVRILCRISKEAISDHYQEEYGPHPNDKQCLELAQKYFDELSDLVAQKIYKNHFEKDGSITLRSNEW